MFHRKFVISAKQLHSTTQSRETSISIWEGGWKIRLLSPPCHVQPRHTVATRPLLVQTQLNGDTDVPSRAENAPAMTQEWKRAFEQNGRPRTPPSTLWFSDGALTSHISALDCRTDLDFYCVTSAIWYVTMTAYHGLCFSFSK